MSAEGMQKKAKCLLIFVDTGAATMGKGMGHEAAVGMMKKGFITMAYEGSKKYFRYPEPDRSNHKPSLDLGPEKDYVDIGWSDGILSDGRPFRVEYWCWDEVSILTYFMSTRGIEHVTDNYFRELLVDEGLLSFSSDKPTLKAKKIKDASGNEMWSVNVAVGNQEELFVKETLFIKRYRRSE